VEVGGSAVDDLEQDLGEVEIHTLPISARSAGSLTPIPRIGLQISLFR
jgi:hypothetical protein